MSQNIPNSGLSARVCLKNHATNMPARTLISISMTCALSTWVMPSQAQESFAPDAVVSAARTAQVVTDALPSTTVITRADIESATVGDVVSLLRQQVGVNIRQAGARGAQTGISIRGGEPKHTLVLIDGVALNNLSAGTASLEQIPLALIERIEIVRGNVSALYGSQATGGLVQIFTRNVRNGHQLDMRAAVGDKGQRQTSAQLFTGNDTVQITAGVAHDRVNAISAQNDSRANPDKDPYKNTSGNLQIRVTPSDKHEFGVRFYEATGKSDFDVADVWSPIEVSNRHYLDTRNQQLSLYSNNQWTKQWSSRVQLSRLVDELDNHKIDSTGASLGTQRFRTTHRELSWQNQLNTDYGTGIAGLSYNDGVLDSSTQYSRAKRITRSAWLGYVLDKNRQHVQLNVRHDRLSDLGGFTTGAINYGFDITPEWRVFAGYSNGFTAPSFNDMFAPSAWGSNPNLKPEKANYAQAGVQYVREHWGARMTYFDSRYRDKIVYAYPQGMSNIDRARAIGLENHLWLNINGWRVDAGLTWQDVRDRATDARLVRQPRLLANLGVGKTLGAWQAQVDWQAQSDMSDSPYAVRDHVAGFGVLNTSVFYQARKDLKLGLTVGNLFNRNYEPLAGYNAMPRNFLFSVNYKPSW